MSRNLSSFFVLDFYMNWCTIRKDMKYRYLFFAIGISGCAPIWQVPNDFSTHIIDNPHHDIMAYTRLHDIKLPIHIYIEGDGNAFNAYGHPTNNPTPRGTFMRELMASDNHPNVVYLARPCQYTGIQNCTVSDWTDGRFAPEIIKSVSAAIDKIAGNRPIVLIGYSGGAMISGLAILQNPQWNVKKWITIAGVLNHSDWTQYFNDAPLVKSVDMRALPQVSQTHYIAEFDDVVPNELSYKWADKQDIILIPGATHDAFPKLAIDFQ